MKTLFFATIFFLLGISTITSQTFFDEVIGKTWEGNGTIMKTSTEFEMNWSKTLDNQFLRLDFQNQMNTKKGKVIFSATAFYKVKSDSTILGTWFDSQGNMYTLTGEVSNNKLIVNWGTSERQVGKTVYMMMDNGTIEVVDFSIQNGKEVQFGEAIYSYQNKK